MKRQEKTKRNNCSPSHPNAFALVGLKVEKAGGGLWGAPENSAVCRGAQSSITFSSFSLVEVLGLLLKEKLNIQGRILSLS